mgnify:CR=1 FL=1
MPTVLGIDTGGTFTDAVIIDLETKEIHAETKTETTHFHLIDGITKAIEQLEYDHYEEIAYASLSTTLATNALVEGRGCRRGAEVALSLLASRWGMTTEKAIAAIRKEFTERLTETILDSVLAYEKIPTDAKDTRELQTLIDRAFYDNGSLMSFLCKLNLPVIGIGAPIKAWLKDAAEKVQAPALFPQHHQVANAIGAAAGKIRNICHISVQNHEAQGIHVYAPWGRTIFKTDSTGNDPVQNALDYALTEGRRRVEESLRAEGLKNYEILTERKDQQIGGEGEQKLFIAAEIDIIGVVNPNWNQ